MGHIDELFKRPGRHFFGLLLIVGMIAMWSIPIHAANVTITIDCEKGAMKAEEGLVDIGDDGVPSGCPPSKPWPAGPPPPGAIQINPTAPPPLPPGALCATGMAHNKCSLVGYICQPGMSCKDTWNAVTRACMCKCMQ